MFPETKVTLDPAPVIMELWVDAWKHVAKRPVILSLKRSNVPTEPQVVSKPKNLSRSSSMISKTGSAERIDMIETKTAAQAAAVKELIAAHKTQVAAAEKLIANSKKQTAAVEKRNAAHKTQVAAVEKLIAAHKTQAAAAEKLIADNKASVAKLSTEIEKVKKSQAAQQQYIRRYRKVLG
ncbi:hypothetical protein DVH05_015750 [Phytophthora capsici]|nr:hypothetical protein DVH05_015750 [Phytophthora capsici]